MKVHESTVLVTGAASGIGKAIAMRLLYDGMNIVATDVNEAGLTAFTAELNSDELARVMTVSHDVTDEEQWNHAVSQGINHFGRITGLVNNAGITRDASMLKMTPAEFDAVINTHVRAAWLGIRTVVPHMRSEGRGSIVNISSSGRHGVFGQTNYSAAKAGVVGLMKSVAIEQAKYGIRCNAVAPGAIRTPMTEVVPTHVIEEWEQSILLGRLGHPEEIAAAVKFLLSEEASYITGHVLDVNGGEPHL